MEYFDLLFYKYLKGVQGKGRINTNFPAYANGTEQLLPVNASAPATTPFLGDIRYSDGYRDNQYFTYRESPTTVDGLAKIKSIKGNTLVWNQLVDTNTSSVTLTSGHKFITKVGGTYSLVNGTGQSLSVTGGTDEVFDLTLMFGARNEPTTVDEFTSLFPLPYYAYNSGSLLSFNGTGIKTTNEDGTEEHTTNLPIATYFPTGMKSAGTVYDELTPTKAITRIGAVDLGTLNYVHSGEMFYVTVSDMGKSAQAKCINYDYVGSFGNVSQAQNGTTNGQFGTSRVATYIFIHDSTFSNANAFKSAMSGVYLYYELATETETPITTEDANEALSLLMGKSVSSNNAKQMIDIITKGE